MHYHIDDLIGIEKSYFGSFKHALFRNEFPASLSLNSRPQVSPSPPEAKGFRPENSLYLCQTHWY